MTFLLNRWTCLVFAALLAPVAEMAFGDPDLDGAELKTMVEADWTAQEERLGRTDHDPQATRDAFARAGRLIEGLRRMPDAPGLAAEALAREDLRPVVDRAESLEQEARTDLYRRLRWITRSVALKNPLFADRRLVFLKRRRFISQMLHEYLGYFYDYENIAGGGVYLLKQPGRSLATRDLTGNRLPEGNYTTLALSYDARTIYFAFAERAPQKPDYYSPQRRCFHVYAMDADGKNLRQLTGGACDDFDPCPLPDGDLAFMSTRRGGFGRCHNPWEPLPAYTLHRMDADGGNLKTLSFHETNEWHPSVLGDGRIVYTRWDYVDRSAANYHGLWVSNPDGSAPGILFGNYTRRINACYQPRAIPGSNRVIFVAGAHHAAVGGSLVIVDPARTALDPKTGEDDFGAIETLTPEVCFPEAPGWPKSYFHSPWPLSEDYFLVSFSFDPLPGMGPNEKRDTTTGLYYLDRFGNLELLYREEGISCMYPIPLASRPVPPVVSAVTNDELHEDGEFVLADVSESFSRMPQGRPITRLRIFQVLPKTETHVANQPRIGYANAESARMLLGTVPVEADGSAYFRAPARKPLYFQAVDAAGRAVQTMRSVTYLQPGERRGCVGCHARPNESPRSRPTLATRRPPSTIRPGPDGTRPWSFPRLVQPVLDGDCFGCHDGTGGPRQSEPALTGRPQDTFSRSYENLKPYVRWYEWGEASIRQIVTRPGEGGADRSPLVKVLDDSNHAEAVKLSDADRRLIYLWLDGNAPFYGTYGADQQQAQQRGEAVLPPEIQ
jgi:Tol biopolymer transport system component